VLAQSRPEKPHVKGLCATLPSTKQAQQASLRGPLPAGTFHSTVPANSTSPSSHHPLLLLSHHRAPSLSCAGSELYEGEYELPPSQNPSPAKAKAAGKRAAKSASKQGKEQAALVPAPASAKMGVGGSGSKRTQHGAAAAAAAAEQQPKKTRSSGRLRG
jgi:hypothetical protein